jgi:YL1 nuclear protein C-terminal domain
MSGSAVQRKAWNEAMRNAAGASAMLHPSLQAQIQKRRSDRRKKQDRRDKARKVQVTASHGEDQGDFHAAVWLDALEDIDAVAISTQDDDDDYNVMDELEDDDAGDNSNSKKGSNKKGRKRKSPAAASTGVLPKRFLPRSLGAILMEEANREGGVARAFVDAEARTHNQLPRRKFCPVSGLQGIYTEPKSGIPYANQKALEQIRERAPPWMTLAGTNTSYWEAAKSLREDE